MLISSPVHPYIEAIQPPTRLPLGTADALTLAMTKHTKANDTMILTWTDEFSKDEYHVFGSVEVLLCDGQLYDVGCTVEIPASQRSTYDISQNPGPFLVAHCDNDGDLDDVPKDLHDHIIEMLDRNAMALWREATS